MASAGAGRDAHRRPQKEIQRRSAAPRTTPRTTRSCSATRCSRSRSPAWCSPSSGSPSALHTRREGKLGGFTLGLVVICSTTVLMAVRPRAEALDRRAVLPRRLGALGAEHRARPRRHRGASGAGARPPQPGSVMRAPGLAVGAARGLARSRPRDAAAAGRPSPPNVPASGALTRAAPPPDPRSLRRRSYLRSSACAFVGLLALVLHRHVPRSSRTKLFKGQADGWTIRARSSPTRRRSSSCISCRWRRSWRRLATIGGLDADGRADRHAGVRRQPVSRRAPGWSCWRSSGAAACSAWTTGCWRTPTGGPRVLEDADSRDAPPHGQHGREPELAGRPGTARSTTTPRSTLAPHAASVCRSSSRHDLAVPADVAQPTPNGPRCDQRDGHGRPDGWMQRFPRASSDRARDVRRRARSICAPPERFSGDAQRGPELMTFGELREHIRRWARAGSTVAGVIRSNLHRKLAFPLGDARDDAARRSVRRHDRPPRRALRRRPGDHSRRSPTG